MSNYPLISCQKCGVSIRRFPNNRKYCDECREIVKKDSSRIRQQEYRNKHRNEILQKRREAYQKNAEEERQKQKEWREKNKEWLLDWRRQKYAMEPERHREYAKNWYHENKEISQERTKEWKRQNPDNVLASKRLHYKKNKAKYAEYREKNKERRYEQRQKWQKQNMLKVRRLNNHRNALKLGAEGNHTSEQFESLCNELDWKCAYCGCSLDLKTVTEDHVTPLSRGGSDDISNILPACQPCNSRKHNKTLDEYFEYIADVGGV